MKKSWFFNKISPFLRRKMTEWRKRDNFRKIRAKITRVRNFKHLNWNFRRFCLPWGLINAFEMLLITIQLPNDEIWRDLIRRQSRDYKLMDLFEWGHTWWKLAIIFFSFHNPYVVVIRPRWLEKRLSVAKIIWNGVSSEFRVNCFVFCFFLRKFFYKASKTPYECTCSSIINLTLRLRNKKMGNRVHLYIRAYTVTVCST